MRKVLVVDDDPALRRLMHLELDEVFEVIDTGEPEQGLALALEHRPDAILLDLRMPNYSGYELCQRFTSFSLTQKIPVLIVSGEAGAETKEYVRELGAAGYFEKPINFEALKARLTQIARPQKHVPRTEVRIPLRVSLRLKGVDAAGQEFEQSAVTENVSLSGFLCSAATNIPANTLVEVYMAVPRKEYVGTAAVVRSENQVGPLFRYGCRFREKTGKWVLQ
ncbi:MAG TPA: response regulator [Candidatus Acidoferrales bacterium]|nr:response regulator [Candidatus Acidoferrales bacterium]